MEYRVILKVKKSTTEFCDCSYCEGHTHEDKIDFNELIEAETKDAAKREAIEQIKGIFSIDPDDLDKIIILAPGEKILTRKAELDLLERWNKGLGLPDRPIDVEYAY